MGSSSGSMQPPRKAGDLEMDQGHPPRAAQTCHKFLLLVGILTQQNSNVFFHTSKAKLWLPMGHHFIVKLVQVGAVGS